MIRKIIGICGLVTILALCSAGVVKADAVDNFVYTVGGNTYTWQLPAVPGPSTDNVSATFGFILNNVAVSENGGVPILVDMGFYTGYDLGGLDFGLSDVNFVSAIGPQLFTGSEFDPTFAIGTFLLTDFGSADIPTSAGDFGVPGTLVISSAAVPEPSTSMLLIVGSLGLLLAARRRG